MTSQLISYYLVKCYILSPTQYFTDRSVNQTQKVFTVLQLTVLTFNTDHSASLIILIARCQCKTKR